ncbi:MAG: polyprenol monophosphomannose synthase [Thaumarchaeota archaeon]|nr:MAG: polyprenol monophosphomannose synthase [Nitrososphaerota archaeon]
MPTYNEADNVRWLVPRVLDLLEEAGWRCMVIVVDDNSPDGTAEEAERIAEQRGGVDVIRRPGKLGIGSAYIDGFRRALEKHGWAEYICEMDADGSHPPETLLEMLEHAERGGADVVVGSRYIEGGCWVEGSLKRVMISRGANLIARISTGLRVRDATSGFRVIRASALKRIIGELKELRSGYVFQVQLLYLLHKAGCRIEEHPLRFLPRRAGKSKLGKEEMLSYASWCLRTFAGRLLGG